MLNRSGLSNESWGTPLVTGCQMDLTPLTTTLWARLKNPASVSPRGAYAHPNHGQPSSPASLAGSVVTGQGEMVSN